MLDYEKTGNFIALKRKQQGMTQKQLAERLAISDKTVSKWETGRSAPDNSILLDLCNVLDVRVNELLSGEEISEDIYVRRAEENLVEMIKEEERRGAGRMGIILEFLLLLLMLFIMLLGFTDGYRNIMWFFDWGSFVLLVGAAVLELLIAGMLPDFARAFPLGFGKRRTAHEEEIQRALTAVKAVFITLPLSGMLVFVTGFILLTDRPMGEGELLPNIGAAMLAFLYSILLDLLLLPLAVRLKKRL